VTLLDSATIPSPFDWTKQAAWFPVDHQMYVTDLNGPTVKRSPGGPGIPWETIFTFPSSAIGDKVVYVPRGAGELWATGADPLNVASWDGTTLTIHTEVPALDTGGDTNALTGIGYYAGRVWLAARDGASGIAIFREDIGVSPGGVSRLLQEI
jgi:hypothetical protein